MWNHDTLETILSQWEEKRKRAEDEADRRCEAAEKRNPRLHLLGEEKRAVPLRVLNEAMRGGADLAERIEAIRRESRTVQEEYRKEWERMGLDPQDLFPHRDCARCGDTGYVGQAMCSCLKSALIARRYQGSGMERLLKRQRFDNFDLSYYSERLLPEKTYSPRDVMASHLNYCRQYAAEFSTESPSLLFIGGTGLGKTHLSTAIAGEVIGKGFDVVYETAANVVSIFEKERFLPEEEAQGTRRLFEAELLILDDLGTETASKANTSAIYRLINHRASVAGLPTLINTNLSAKQLEKQYDTATYSRLLGEFETKVFFGSDIRLAKLK